jgi:hypothetical protein
LKDEEKHDEQQNFSRRRKRRERARIRSTNRKRRRIFLAICYLSTPLMFICVQFSMQVSAAR